VVAIISPGNECHVQPLARAGAIAHVSVGVDAAELTNSIRRSSRCEPSISQDLALHLLRESTRAHMGLTEREQAILDGIIAGATNREIAVGLGLAEKTVKNRVTHILDKLGVRDRTQAAVYALQAGLVDDSATTIVETKRLRGGPAATSRATSDSPNSTSL
jgi:DNA-binding NarL/FixJ family response regulator